MRSRFVLLRALEGIAERRAVLMGHALFCIARKAVFHRVGHRERLLSRARCFRFALSSCRELKRTGGTRFAPPLAATVYQVYQCQKCQQEIKRRRRINTKRYVCGNCQGKLKFLKTIEA